MASLSSRGVLFSRSLLLPIFRGAHAKEKCQVQGACPRHRKEKRQVKGESRRPRRNGSAGQARSVAALPPLGAGPFATKLLGSRLFWTFPLAGPRVVVVLLLLRPGRMRSCASCRLQAVNCWTLGELSCSNKIISSTKEVPRTPSVGGGRQCREKRKGQVREKGMPWK